MSEMSEMSKYIEFNLGDQKYAIPLLSIKEVIPVPSTTAIPQAPHYYLGVMNLRGQIISILDLRKKIGIKPNTESEEAVVILELDGYHIGVVVDSINRVFNVVIENIRPVSDFDFAKNTKNFVSGVFKTNDELIVIMDLNKVLDIPKVESVAG